MASPAKYETGPQGGLEWIAAKFASMQTAIGEANRRATLAQTQVAAAAKLSVASPTLGANLTANLVSLVRDAQNVCSLVLDVTATAALAQNALLLTLPTGFRTLASVEGDDGFAGVAYNGSAWVAGGAFSSNDGTLKLLFPALPSGGVLRLKTTYVARG